MFIPELSINANCETITFIDFGGHPNYPTECLVTYNPEVYHAPLQDLEGLEDYFLDCYNGFAVLHKDPRLLENGVIHLSLAFPEDMCESIRTTLAQTVKTEIHNFILARSIRLNHSKSR